MVRPIEESTDLLVEATQGISPPRRSVLEKPIEVLQHIGRERTSENGPGPESTRAPLHGTVEPADEIALGKGRHRSLDDRGLTQPLVVQLAVVERGFGFLCTEFRSEERTDWSRSRSGRMQGDSNRQPRVARIDRNKHIVEDARPLDQTAKVTIVEETPRHTEVRLTRCLPHGREHREQDLP
jgi:hypothetical protein